jgi:hypothetical protein
MSVAFHKPPTENFTQTPNAWLRDPGLSMKAKVLIAYIISHEPGYDLTVKQMVAQMKEGADAIYAGLKELEDLGYLVRHRRRGERGKLGGIDWEVIATPDQTVTTSGFSRRGQSRSGETTSGGSVTKKTTVENTKVQEDQSSEETTSLSTHLDELDRAWANSGAIPNQRRERVDVSKDQKFKSSKHRILSTYGWNEVNADSLIKWIEERYEPYSDGWWFTAHSNGSLIERIQEVLDDYNAEHGTSHTADMWKATA